MNFNFLFIPLMLNVALLIDNQQFFNEQRFANSTQTTFANDSTVQSYEDEIRAWHDRRTANLKRDHGWLTLVALDWLNEGANELPSAGTITIGGNGVSIHLASGIQATIGGKPFTSGRVRTDADEGGPDKIEFGTRAFVVIKRGDRYAVRMWDTAAEGRKQFKGIERFPVSPAWRMEARWEPYDPPKQIKVPSVIPGYDQDYPVPGVAAFTIEGKEYQLEPVLEPGEEDLFFIFGDKTNGKETYGAGRFLYAKPSREGKVIIDFNKAYNPPCAFTPYATCPLPPKSNRLPVRIEAGEKTYGEH